MKNSKIKLNTNKRPFVMLYHDFIKCPLLNWSEKDLYIILLMYADKDSKQCFPSINELCKVAGKSKNTILKAISGLESKKILKKEKRVTKNGQTSNLYTLYDIDTMWESKNIDELKTTVDEIEERKMIEALTAKGYYISKEKELESAAPTKVTAESSTHTHVDNLNINENITNEPKCQEKPCSTSKADADALLNRLWRLYPVKKGKGRISAAQKKKLLKIGYDEMARAIERYKRYVESVDYLHYQYGGTFFNGGYVDYLDANYDPKSELEVRSSQTKSSQKKNMFNDYPHREYDFDEIERTMFDQ